MAAGRRQVSNERAVGTGWSGQLATGDVMEANSENVAGRHRAGGTSLADVVDTLAAVYEPVLGLQTVVLVTRRCHRELQITGNPAGGLEALARRRLQDLAAVKS